MKLINIRPDDIVDGNPKLTLALIWTLILHFQVSCVRQCGDDQYLMVKHQKYYDFCQNGMMNGVCDGRRNLK